MYFLLIFIKNVKKCSNGEKIYPRNGSSIKYVSKIFRKTKISNPLIRTRTCACQGVRNVSFSEDFAYVLNG